MLSSFIVLEIGFSISITYFGISAVCERPLDFRALEELSDLEDSCSSTGGISGISSVSAWKTVPER